MSYTPRYDKGDWIADCDVCGRKYKASILQKRWDGLMCCPDDWEIRQPQDFVRGVPDTQVAPWTRPEPQDQFITIPYTEYPTDTLTTSDTIVKQFTKYINPALYDPNAINGYAINLYAINAVKPIPAPDPTQDDNIQVAESIAVFTGFGRVLSDSLTFSETIRVFKPAPEAINGAVINFGAINS